MNEYPKWIKATVPGAGEVDLVAQSKAEEAAVKDGTASFKFTHAAGLSGGDTYSIVLPEPVAKPVEEPHTAAEAASADPSLIGRGDPWRGFAPAHPTPPVPPPVKAKAKPVRPKPVQAKRAKAKHR